MFNLNQRAMGLAEALVGAADELRASVSICESGARIVDCGVKARGGLETGRRLAEICLAGLGRVAFVSSSVLPEAPAVQVATDQPVAACLASQYAGWQLAAGKFFAMGSGPMRATAGREDLFDRIGLRETSDVAVGVLESSKLPPPEVCRDLAAKCGVAPERLALFVARTASLAGTVQIVARSVETALHKLDSLGFDLSCVRSGLGNAPLPPVASDDLVGIGRTNDAILYGGDVTLWVETTDEALTAMGPRVPSSASRDHGRPFAELFQRAGGDFYKLDPHLFSPAVVTFVNLATGNSFRFGTYEPAIMRQSFGNFLSSTGSVE